MVAQDALDKIAAGPRVVVNASGQTMTTVDEHLNHHHHHQQQQQEHNSPSLGVGGGGMTGGRNRSFHTIKCYPGGGNGNGITPNHTHNSNTSNNNGGFRLNSGANNGYVNGSDKFSPPPSSSSSSSRFLSPPIQHHVRISPHRSQSERNGRWIKVPSMETSGGEGSSPTIPKVLYRSNSSLDLEQQDFMEDKGVIGALRREYGSASSIDVMSTSGESFFAMLSNYDAEKIDQRSPGPAKIAEYLRGRIETLPVAQNASNALSNGGCTGGGSGGGGGGYRVDIPEETLTSPKTKNKFQRLWETKEKSKAKGGRSGSEPSSSSSSSSSSFILRKLRGGGGGGGSNKGNSDCNSAETSSKGSDNSLDADGRCEEKLRRKAFAHFDVQSVTANLVYASRLRNLLGRRRNTTTGASAASMANRCLAVSGGSGPGLTGSSEDLCGRGGGGGGNAQDDSDAGDSRSNELLLSCPFFRNELGGEEERLVSLARPIFASSRRSRNVSGGSLSPVIHRCGLSCGLAILEGANETHWKSRTCPYQRHPLRRENVDLGALYYQQYFQGQEHQNWFGIDDTLGPVAVSIRREKLDCPFGSYGKEASSLTNQQQYRLIIRTSELATLRGTVLEEAIPALRQLASGSGSGNGSGGGSGNSGRSLRVKEVLDYVAPELQLPCLRLGLSCPQTEEQLLKLDQQGLTNHYKVGILYCRAGQSTEEEMYNNEHPGPAFDEFLDAIGQRVRLKGFDKYRAQLDNKTDSTGLFSVYSTYADCEVMFHVSTMLPYSPNNRQQLLRKRHIGNDIVTIVFQEPGAAPFTPRSIRSHFQHVFVIVRAHDPCSDNTRYSVAVSRSKEVPVFGPRIPECATFSKSKAFADFLLAKVINAENAAHRSDKFATMATRTRQEYLKDLANNHVSTTSLDTAPKFQILSFGGKKKEKPPARGSRFIPDASVRGAIAWQVQVDDHGRCAVLDCALAVSSDALVLVDEAARDVVFACPCSSVLGWSSHTNSLRVYYHQGECVIVRTKDPDVDEIQEIVSRVSCVTRGCETQEFTLRRNSLGQLGFHVQQDGLITEVEQYGFAWQAGLRHNSRLVEICKVVVSTLTYDQMVDLLKTSILVTVTVIPPLNDGSPRRGCNLHNCGYLVSRNSNCGGDYENVNVPESDGGDARPNRRMAAVVTTSSSPIRCPTIPARQVPSSGASSSSTRSANDGNANSSPTKSTQSSSSYGRTGRSVANLEQRFRSANNEMTSASSQSSEEKWYDMGELADSDVRSRVQGAAPTEGAALNPPMKESPPPLPARHAVPASTQSAGNHFRRDNHQGGGPSSSSSSSQGFHGSGNYAHLPPPSGRLVVHHSDHQRVESNQMTRSLNIGSEGSGIDRLTGSGGESRGYKNYARVAPFQHNISDQVLHDRLHRLRSSMASAVAGGIKIRPPQSVLSSPGGSVSERQLDLLLVDRCQSSRSEDEQSGGSSTSNSLSPKTRRRQPLQASGASSASSSKNQSPHTIGRSQLDVADVQKRFGLSNFRGSSESTFQEDLLKLINPDLIDSEDASQELEDRPTFKRPRTPPIPSKTNSLDRGVVASREASSRSSTRSATSSSVHINSPSTNSRCNGRDNSNNGGAVAASTSSHATPLNSDVIFTTARPATVISTASTSSSPAPSEPKLTKEERLSPRATTTNAAALTSKSLSSLPTSAIMPLPDSSNEIDWPSLVDTATKAMQGELVPSGVSVSSTIGDLIPWIDDVTSRLGLDPLPTANTRRIRELEFRVRILEEELTKERHRKAALEMEVRRLRNENIRLQEESNTAAAQLRRFTEWFFQAIDN